jgi:hypothetical protein
VDTTTTIAAFHHAKAVRVSNCWRGPCLSGARFSVGSLNRQAKALLQSVGVDALVVALC